MTRRLAMLGPVAYLRLKLGENWAAKLAALTPKQQAALMKRAQQPVLVELPEGYPAPMSGPAVVLRPPAKKPRVSPPRGICARCHRHKTLVSDPWGGPPAHCASCQRDLLENFGPRARRA